MNKIRSILGVVTIVFLILGMINILPLGISYFIGYMALGIVFSINCYENKDNRDKSYFYEFLVGACVDYFVAIYYLIFK